MIIYSMRKSFLLIGLTFLLCGCEKEDLPPYHEILDSYIISCPEPPIEIMSNVDAEAASRNEISLNYFSIVQLKVDLFYMYYEAFREHINDFEQAVCFAFSNDGIHWERAFPNRTDEDNVVIPNNISGVSVILVSDKENPFRMFGYCKKESGYALFMWKSNDGFSFKEKKEILSGVFDTQSVGVQKGNLIKLYTRQKEQNGMNRKIAVAYIDMDGNVIDSPKVLQDNYVYNLDKNIEIKKIIRKFNKIEEEKILEYFDLKSK